MLLLPLLLATLLLPLLTLCAEDYYKLLGLDRTASERDIKKAYRTLSKKYHPDKNPGDDVAAQRFVSVAEAYEALSNEETRRIYDQYGEEGLKQHAQGGSARAHDPFDLFSRFFGGGGHFGHATGERRGPDMSVRIAIPLRDFYNGATREFSVEKQHVCEACEGSGSADGKVDACGQCGGRGIVIQKHMLAPGIFQQMQGPCDRCGGKGKVVRRPCKVCGGQRVVREHESHTLHVERGMPKGARVNFENEADESPDWVAGDLVVVLAELEPRILDGVEDGLGRVDGNFMRRKGDDLFWTEVLSLREAWMGDWKRHLTHLDGRILTLSRKRGQVVQPGTVEMIEEEGMPIWRSEGEEAFGNLVVKYEVVLPDRLDGKMQKEFWDLWEKWRGKIGIDLLKDSGRPSSSSAGGKPRDEL